MCRKIEIQVYGCPRSKYKFTEDSDNWAGDVCTSVTGTCASRVHSRILLLLLTCVCGVYFHEVSHMLCVCSAAFLGCHPNTHTCTTTVLPREHPSLMLRLATSPYLIRVVHVVNFVNACRGRITVHCWPTVANSQTAHSHTATHVHYCLCKRQSR